jgi:two-component system, cell cycle response regulator
MRPGGRLLAMFDLDGFKLYNDTYGHPAGDALLVRLSHSLIDAVARASALHDIGKLAIPEEILEKPELLTTEEWKFVGQHTVIGERILAAAPSMAACAKIVRSSHETRDGTGYPDGLAGEQIPLEARIIFACDAFEAMTTTRPYRRARTPGYAIAELQRCAGTQFDPDVVHALVAEVHERLGPATSLRESRGPQSSS